MAVALAPILTSALAVLPRGARSRVFGAMNRSMAERVTPATPPPVHAAE